MCPYISLISRFNTKIMQLNKIFINYNTKRLLEINKMLILLKKFYAATM